MAGRRPQKGKDGKRNRAFHRGRAQGRINDKLLRNVLEPAFAAAAQDRADGAETAKIVKGELRDHRALLEGLARVAPAAGLLVPSPLI